MKLSLSKEKVVRKKIVLSKKKNLVASVILQTVKSANHLSVTSIQISQLISNWVFLQILFPLLLETRN